MKQGRDMVFKPKQSAVTLTELLVVVMIMGILASIAVTVYTGHVDRARVAACRDIIRQIELAVNCYEIDTGQIPPSSSGLTFAPDALVYEGNATQGSFGSGYLQLALLHSLSGDLHRPLHYRWLGPYIELDEEQLGDRFGMSPTASTPMGYVQILDPWGMPYYYIRSDNYSSLGGTRYPTDHPFYASETWYNPSSFQIFSMGRNGTTYAVPYRGEETDDVNNWRKYGTQFATSGGSGGRRYAGTYRGTNQNLSRGQGNGVLPGSYQTGGGKSGTLYSSSTGAGVEADALADRRPVSLSFDLSSNLQMVFKWPEGWIKDSHINVLKPKDDTKPVWMFKYALNQTFEQVCSPFKQVVGAKVLFEGADPTNTIPDSWVLEVNSKSIPDADMQKHSKDKPYHVIFLFKAGDYTCWWGASFATDKSMDEGRLFITGIVRSKRQVVKKEQ